LSATPEEAASFVAATKVDALAVAVGTSHAMLTQDATLDFELIRQLGARVAVPLVLHGSSGVSDADLTRAVVAGITKVNIATRLSKAFTAAVRTCLEENPSVVDTRKYLGKAREVVAAEVSRILQVLATVGNGRQAAVPSERNGHLSSTTIKSWFHNVIAVWARR
jgi:fructose-bisphosphate aldolase class II